MLDLVLLRLEGTVELLPAFEIVELGPFSWHCDRVTAKPELHWGMTGSLLGCCCGRDAGGDNAVKGVPIVPSELFPDSTSGEVLDIVGDCLDCDSIVSGDLNPFPFAGTITDGKEATKLLGIIKKQECNSNECSQKSSHFFGPPSNFLSSHVVDDNDFIYVCSEPLFVFPSFLAFLRVSSNPYWNFIARHSLQS